MNLIVKPLYIFGVDRSVNNIVGSSEYGFYFSLLSFSYILQMVNDFGIQNFTSKTIAEQPENAAKYFSNLFIFKLLLSFAYFLLTFIVAFGLGYNTVQLKLLLILTFVQILTSFFLFFRANLSGLGFFKTDSFLSVFDRLGLLLLCGFLLWYQFITAENGIWILAISQSMSMLVACLIAYFFLIKKIKHEPFDFDFDFLKKIIKDSFPFALIALLMTFYTRSDAVMLERLLNDNATEAGIYASSYRLLDALNSVTLVFGTLLLPMFSRQINAQESTKPLLELSLTIVSFLGISASFSIYAFREPIVHLLYPTATPYWADLLGLLILSYIPLSLMYVLGAYSTAKNLLRPQHYLFFIIAILNFGLNLFLIPSQKAIGAAIATLLTQCAVVVGFLIINQFQLNWIKISKSLIFCVLYGFFLFFIQKNNWHWLFQFVCACSFALLCGLVLFGKTLLAHRSDD
jgi:O-antigen/teichoic acid export membrane protein